MGGDENIASALPRPPLPAPARRESAIAEALRRLDGAAPAAENPTGSRAAPWWSAKRRPYAGALAGAFLVALIGLPLVWTSFDRSFPGDGRERRPAAETAGPAPAMADADVSGADTRPPVAADESPGAASTQVAEAGPSRVPGPGEAPVGRSEGSVAGAAAADETGDVLVTGSRIARPNLESASPVTAVGEDTVEVDEDDRAITVTGTRSRYAPPRRRGDWNACTVDDPGHSLAACRKLAERSATGASGSAADRVAEGVSKAWEGDLDAAVESFDRAIEIAPRSSAAYLNRALARRRLGDLDGALADLDRAVRYSPRAARYYYHRSLILHQRGDHRRARADEQRAVELDPRYGVAVKGGQ